MKRQLLLTTEPLNEANLLAERLVPAEAGAVIYFLGYVRGVEAGAAISGLEYEAYQAMAEHQFQRLFDHMEARWPVLAVRLAHRLGVVRVGEPSLWVEVVAPHRQEAFAACQFLIDEMKRVVPIWKKPLKPASQCPSAHPGAWSDTASPP